MSKRLLSILQYFIFLGGGIFLVWYQLSAMTSEEKKEFSNALSEANYWLIVPIVVLSLLSHLSRSMRWKLLMEPLGYHPKLKNVFSVTMIGYLINAVIPRLGEILKCTFLARYEKLKVDKLVGTIIVERTFDFLCYIIFMAITVLIQVKVVGGFARKNLLVLTDSPGFPIWAKLLILISAIITFLFFIRILFNRYPGNKVIFMINNFKKGLIEGFRSIRRLKHRKAFMLHTLFIWTMYLLQIYIGFFAMEGTSHLGMKAACSVLSLATLAMIATPGGIGSFPLFVMQTLAIYSIPWALGKAFGWLIWGVATGIVILAGFIALLILPYLNKKKNEIGPIDPGKNLYPG